MYLFLDAEFVEVVYNAVIKPEIEWTNISIMIYISQLVWGTVQPEKSKADPTSDKGSRPGVRRAGPSGPVLGYQEERKFHPNIRIKEAEKKEIIARDCCIHDVLHTCVYISRTF